MKMKDFGPLGGRPCPPQSANDNVTCRQTLMNFSVSSGGSKGRRPLPPHPHGPKCSQFHAVFGDIWLNCMLASPPTENSGSVTIGAKFKDTQIFQQFNQILLAAGPPLGINKILLHRFTQNVPFSRCCI